MHDFDYAIVFACYNQVAYTRQFVDSLVSTGVDLARVVAVDNASTDDTRNYLETLSLGQRIYNRTNLGCGVAWNQGALALQSEWTIIMNNDVLVTPDWLGNLIEAARRHDLKIVSPALVEGGADYNLVEFARDAAARMGNALRAGASHAVCLAVHESVWMDIGYFRPVPKLWGYEDTLFFHAAELARLPMGITGSAWLHHFGSITQKAMKEKRGQHKSEELGNHRSNHRLLNLSWWERKLRKLRRVRQGKRWREHELKQFGMSMHGVRRNGEFQWL